MAGALAGAVGGAMPRIATAAPRATAPSDRLRVGFLGAGARAHQLIDGLHDVEGAEIVSLCDTYTGRAERGRARAGGRATIQADYRAILDDASVDAVVIATPDHWHHRMALDALDAGKDVYIEKPLTDPEQFTATLACTLNSEAGAESGMEILGTKGTLRFRNGGLDLTAEQPQENNRWVVRSWPEALERGYYADPKVQAIETPDTWRQRATPSGERWNLVGEDETVAHLRGFAESVRTRRQPVEDARFGHQAAACAHMINTSIRENRVVRWDTARDTIAS